MVQTNYLCAILDCYTNKKTAMIELQGKFANAKIFATTIEEGVCQQVYGIIISNASLLTGIRVPESVELVTP